MRRIFPWLRAAFLGNGKEELGHERRKIDAAADELADATNGLKEEVRRRIRSSHDPFWELAKELRLGHRQ